MPACECVIPHGFGFFSSPLDALTCCVRTRSASYRLLLVCWVSYHLISFSISSRSDPLRTAVVLGPIPASSFVSYNFWLAHGIGCSTPCSAHVNISRSRTCTLARGTFCSLHRSCHVFAYFPPCPRSNERTAMVAPQRSCLVQPFSRSRPFGLARDIGSSPPRSDPFHVI